MRTLRIRTAVAGVAVPASSVSWLRADVGARHDATHPGEPARLWWARLHVVADGTRGRSRARLGSRPVHAWAWGEMQRPARLSRRSWRRGALERRLPKAMAHLEPR